MNYITLIDISIYTNLMLNLGRDLKPIMKRYVLIFIPCDGCYSEELIPIRCKFFSIRPAFLFLSDKVFKWSNNILFWVHDDWFLWLFCSANNQYELDIIACIFSSCTNTSVTILMNVSPMRIVIITWCFNSYWILRSWILFGI